jgi:hypothetical protein
MQAGGRGGTPCRVDRVLSFSPVVGVGTPPTPHPQAREGVGDYQFRRGDIHCGTLNVYVLCGVPSETTS